MKATAVNRLTASLADLHSKLQTELLLHCTGASSASFKKKKGDERPLTVLAAST